MAVYQANATHCHKAITTIPAITFAGFIFKHHSLALGQLIAYSLSSQVNKTISFIDRISQPVIYKSIVIIYSNKGALIFWLFAGIL